MSAANPSFLDLHPLSLAMLFATASLAAVVLVGWVAERRKPGHPLSRLASPYGLLIAAGVLTLTAGAAQWWFTRRLIASAYVAVEGGWVKQVSLSPTGSLASTSSLLGELQSIAAGCVALLVPLSWVGAWTESRRHGRSGQAASLAAAVALSVPVLVGSLGVRWVVTQMAQPANAEPLWAAWHAIEAAKWAVAGGTACVLMAATPIVVHAASLGRVVSTRSYRLAQVLLLTGLAAWSTSRFASEDLVRGPIAQLSTGSSARRSAPVASGVAEPSTGLLDLPTAAQCSELPLDLRAQQPLPLTIDEDGRRYDGAGRPWWRDPGTDAQPMLDPNRSPVLVAAIDRRTKSEAFRPYLRAARRRGVRRIAVLTRLWDRETSLTLGELSSPQRCVMGWVELDSALVLAADPVRWSTVAYHAAHTDD